MAIGNNSKTNSIYGSKTCRFLTTAAVLLVCFILYVLFLGGDIQQNNKPFHRIEDISVNGEIEITNYHHHHHRHLEKPMKWLDRAGSDKYNYYGDGSCPPSKDRKIYLNLLKRWLEIADELNIEYFLTFGTLLGAWRDEEVIPWDRDMDLHMNVNDFYKLAKIRETKDFETEDDLFHVYVQRDWRLPYQMRRRFNCDGEQVKSYSGQCSFVEPFARLIKYHDHLDIYVYTTYYDTVKCLPEDGDEYLKSDVFPIVRCMFMGLESRCPRNAKAILDIQYNKKLIPRDLCFNKTFHRNEIAYKDP